MSRSRWRVSSAGGFTLMEVLVAIVITGIGLLGLAKMQALAISSTHGSGGRSLVALQASSLAAAMRGNIAFWHSGSPPASFSLSGGTVTDASGVLNQTPPACDGSTSTPCTPAQLAAYDVQQWSRQMQGLMPTYSALVTCPAPSAGPRTCIINISWLQGAVAVSKSQSQATQPQKLSYALYVTP